MTPAMVHYVQTEYVRKQRTQVLAAAYKAPPVGASEGYPL